MNTGRDQRRAARLPWALVALALLVSGSAIGGIELGGNLAEPMQPAHVSPWLGSTGKHA